LKKVLKGNFDDFNELILKKFEGVDEETEFSVNLSLDKGSSFAVGLPGKFTKAFHLAQDLSARLKIPVIDETKSTGGIEKEVKVTLSSIKSLKLDMKSFL